MSDLLMHRSAVISDCKTYRYELWRIWDERKPALVVCMLNPSRADDEVEDPTLLALIHFASLWGYGGLRIVNLYAFRSPSPKVMFAAGNNAMGPENEKYLTSAVLYARDNGGKLLAAWGDDGEERSVFFVEWARTHGVDLICLGTTQNGAPKHPMARGKHRIPRDQQPAIWRAAH